MSDTFPQAIKATKPRIPIEVCERVIDHVSSEHVYVHIPTSLATLSNCALVCRDWRPRAQRVLFDYVILRDKDSLYRFAELLDASPELGGYVRILDLRGYHHVPNSPMVLFPTVLRGRLTNLRDLYIVEPVAAKPLPEGTREFPSLPIHKSLPTLMASFSHIRGLKLMNVTFPSFGDFCRFLNPLSNLDWLHCGSISWAVFGLVPPCMDKKHPHISRHTFLPRLEMLECYDMDEQGRRRLLLALGPSLRRLHINFPNEPLDGKGERLANDMSESDIPLTLDRQSFPHLNDLTLKLEPFLQWEYSTLESLRDILVSWVTPVDVRSDVSSAAQRCLHLEPWDRVNFTREAFVELLRTVRPAIEAAVCRTPDTAGANPCLATLSVGNLGDKPDWADWWRESIEECFPTIARWKRLNVDALGTDDPELRWIDDAPMRQEEDMNII